MKKKIATLLLASILIAGLSACSMTKETDVSKSTPAKASFADGGSINYEEAVKEAKGSTVTFYGFGGDEKLNKWMDTSLALELKDKYDLTLERVPMNIEDVLAQLSGEKQAGTKSGTIDMIWINGENFYSTKENGLLYGPFAQSLPNMEQYIDLEDNETLNDFCYPIDGYEVPYSKAQLVLMNDSAVTPQAPSNSEELMKFCKTYPGKVTYAALPDFTASAFVRNIIYDICGYEQFTNMNADKATVKAAIEPALEYLRSLNPFLWKEGKTFPASSDQVDTMFQNGELVMNMSYNAFKVGAGIENGIYSETTRTFLFDKGTIGNTNYIGIAKNAPNKAGALVAINEVISAKMQATKYEMTKNVPVIKYEKLSTQEKKEFDRIDTGKGTISQDELLSKRLPEMPAALVPIIEEIWLEEVVGK